MRRTTSVLISLVLSMSAVSQATAQDTGPPTGPGRAGFQLEQNYPNPFNPETTIPFSLSPELFAEGRPARVSLRIFNIVAQLVAVPVALRHPAGEGVELVELEYTLPGRYEAFWDGTDQAGRQVASGIYFMQLTVNGVSASKRMYVLK